MPNHVTHRVVVTGPSAAIARFRAAFLVEVTERDPDGTEHPYTMFDFNILVPMPELIAETESGAAVQDGLLVLGRTDIRDGFASTASLHEGIERYLAYPWVQAAGVRDVDGLKSLLIGRNPTCVGKARRAIKAYELYGHASWYGWSIENWGTKWNSYSYRAVRESDDRFEFIFDTAWSTPEPIFEALADRSDMRNLVIIIHAFDEGWNFAFVGSIRNGQFLGKTLEASDELYRVVYGRPARLAH